MNWIFGFFFNSFMLGVGLAMDAFSVSLVSGLNEPLMKRKKMFFIASVFAVFQAIMPMIGWVCVHTIVQKFSKFEKFVPWIALVLLLFIGGKMLIEGIKNKQNDEVETLSIGIGTVLIQGIATSIDALSVGFTIAEYYIANALVCALIIAVVTFILCFIGILIGKKFGAKISNKAQIFGGIILIIIGIEIYITGII